MIENRENIKMCEMQDRYWWYLSLRKRVLRNVKKYVKGKDILDAGCGCGHTIEDLKNYYNVYGVDIDKELIGILKNRELNVKEGSVNDIPFADEQFDGIVSLDVLCVNGVDEDKAMNEFNRVLKKGGIVVMNLPAMEFMRGRHDEYVNIRKRYTAKEIQSLLRKHGFMPLKIEYWNYYLFPLFFVWRKMIGDKFIKNSSDLFDIPGWLNSLFMFVSSIEVLPFYFGLSVFAVAKKE